MGRYIVSFMPMRTENVFVGQFVERLAGQALNNFRHQNNAEVGIDNFCARLIFQRLDENSCSVSALPVEVRQYSLKGGRPEVWVIRYRTVTLWRQATCAAAGKIGQLLQVFHCDFVSASASGP